MENREAIAELSVKQNLIVNVVAVSALFLCGIGWLVLPSLQGAQRTVDVEAAIHVERARRLLDGYNFGWEYKSLLLDRLAEFDVDVDVEDPDALSEVSADEYQVKHEQLWKAYEPTDWEGPSPRPRSANYGNLGRQIREGIAARTELIEENRLRLDQALVAVKEALSVTSGDASSRSYAEASRLKAVIYYHMGLAEWLGARVTRLQAGRYRAQLAALATQAAEFDAARSLVNDSGVEQHIETLNARLADAEGQLRRHKEELAELDATVRDFKTRIGAAQSRASTARAALGELQARGIDFSDPDAGKTFRTQLMEQDRLYREALREVQSLKAGSYPFAKIDHSGDFLRGRYVENGSSDNLTVEHGLQHFEHKWEVLAAGVGEQERAMEDFHADIARLEGMKAAYLQLQDRAVQQIAEVADKAVDAYAELNRVESEASAIEESALDQLEQSAGIAVQAASAARLRVDNAREMTRSVSSRAKQRSGIAKRTKDKWMGGFMTAQEADARMAKAWIYYARYEAHNQVANVLTRVSQSLQLKEADLEAERGNATRARDAGIEEITKAIGRLEQAHKATNRHWTMVAQEAGAFYLLSMFGETSYRTDAIEAYRNALKGRETEKYAQRFAAALRRLESR